MWLHPPCTGTCVSGIHILNYENHSVVGGAPPYDSGDVVVAMAFLQPGRHAGPGGDVEQILDAARGRSAGLRTHVTPLLGGSHLVHEVLADRTAEAHAALRERLRGDPEA